MMTLDYPGRIALILFLVTLWNAHLSLRVSALERVTDFLLAYSTTI